MRVSLCQAVIALSVVALSSGCAEETTVVSPTEGDAATSVPEPGPMTYIDGMRQVIQEQCVSCHRADGSAPFTLERWEDVEPALGAMRAAVAEGSMPPWLPDPDCREYVAQRVIPEADKTALLAWIDAGAPRGEGEEPAPTPFLAPDAGVVPTISAYPAEPYTPDDTAPDDYRCFLLDATFDQTQYLVGSKIVVDAEPVVHHVLSYLVLEEQVAELQALDDADPGPGWTCFSGPGVSAASPLAGWTPGPAYPLTDNAPGREIPAGSRVVMQMHYNTLAAPTEEDLTRMDMVLVDDKPDLMLDVTALPFLELEIPAGAPSSVQVAEFEHQGDGTTLIVGAAAHMHLLGRSFKLEVLHGAGHDTCLLDIPQWDFSWQQGFVFKSYVPFGPGSKIRMTCEYDNSPEAQPVVNGAQLTPRDVFWGEGTLDEMCLAYLYTVRRD